MSQSAFAKSLNGVTLEDKINIENRVLILNGMGTRLATLFKVKVYVAGLYLENPTSDAAKILNSNETKRVQLQFVHDVSAEKMTRAWREAFQKTCKPNCAQMKPAMEQLVGIMQDYRMGDKMSLTFFPTYVEVVSKNNPPQKLENAAYAKSLLATWLGNEPPNAELKEGMLGHPSNDS